MLACAMHHTGLVLETPYAEDRLLWYERSCEWDQFFCGGADTPGVTGVASCGKGFWKEVISNGVYDNGMTFALLTIFRLAQTLLC